MKKHLTLSVCILAMLSSSGAAFASDAVTLEVSRLGDVEMGCGELSQEAALMRDIIITTQDIKDDSKMKNRGISAAGAVGSFLVGTVTGGIGIAAAGLLLKTSTDNTEHEADGIQDVAEQRRSLMMGIYNAKGCSGPIEHVMQDHIERPTNQPAHVATIETAAGDMGEEKPRYNQ